MRVSLSPRRARTGATSRWDQPAALIDDGSDLRHTLLLFWLLRVACGLEFIGHGAFGVITKAAWVPYFGVIGIPEPWAWRLMPIVGSVDITLGLLVLLKPIRLVLLYMAVWGLWTALLRPLAGEAVWELVERAPNYLIPAALLYLRVLPLSWKDVLR